jgi:hypothetical protein
VVPLRLAAPLALALALAAAACTCPAATAGGAAAPRAPDAAAAPAVDPESRSPVPAPGGGERVVGQYLVTVAPGAGAAPIREAFAAFGVERVAQLAGDLWLVVVKDDPGPERMEDARRRGVRLLAVQPNYRYRAYRAQ